MRILKILERYRRDIIIGSSASFALMVIALDGQLPVLVNVLGILLLAGLCLEFYTLLREDMKK